MKVINVLEITCLGHERYMASGAMGWNISTDFDGGVFYIVDTSYNKVISRLKEIKYATIPNTQYGSSLFRTIADVVSFTDRTEQDFVEVEFKFNNV